MKDFKKYLPMVVVAVVVCAVIVKLSNSNDTVESWLG